MSTGWNSPSRIPPLPFEGTQVWRLQLELQAATDIARAFYALLSKDEKQRADGLRIVPVRNEFIAGRGLLRMLVGAATGMAPKGVLLGTMHNGKPCLSSSTQAHASGLEFNVSHSDGMILIALSRASPVGIDVEFISREFGETEELIAIARESFDEAEFSMVALTPPGRDRLLAFYSAWTRREAIAKADGRGIASLLKYQVFRADEFGEYRVSLAGLPDLAEDNGDMDYFVQMPQPGPHHLAAVAARKPRQQLTLFDAAGLCS